VCQGSLLCPLLFLLLIFIHTQYIDVYSLKNLKPLWAIFIEIPDEKSEYNTLQNEYQLNNVSRGLILTNKGTSLFVDSLRPTFLIFSFTNPTDP